MGRFFNYYKGKFLKLLIYNAFEAGISENNSLRMFYCDYFKNFKVFKNVLPSYRGVKCL